MLGVVSLAQFLGMTLWFSATAVTPLLVREFDIPPGHVAWLTMAVQAGFVAGTLASAGRSPPPSDGEARPSWIRWNVVHGGVTGFEPKCHCC